MPLLIIHYYRKQAFIYQVFQSHSLSHSYGYFSSHDENWQVFPVLRTSVYIKYAIFFIIGSKIHISLLNYLALRHERNVVEYAYVRSCMIPQLTYFAAPLELGPNGIQRYLGIPPLSDYECELLKAAIPCLKEAIKLGEVIRY